MFKYFCNDMVRQIRQTFLRDFPINSGIELPDQTTPLGVLRRENAQAVYLAFCHIMIY